MLKKALILFAIPLPLLAEYGIPPEPIESCQLPVGIFYPAQYDLGNSCFDFTLAGEFLYWKINEDDLESIGNRLRGPFATGEGTQTNYDLLSHQQGYNPGFKVAAGIGFPCFDNWSFDAEYTWFHHQTTNTFAAEPGQIIVSKFIPVTYNVVSSSLKSVLMMHLNFLQGTVGKSFYLSERLIVKAGVGLKSWWASENHNLFFDVITGDLGTQFTKTGFWGIGPYVAAQIRALLWCGIYMQGKVGIWPTYTRLNKYHVETNFPAVPAVFFPGFRDVETNHDQPWVTQLFYEGGIALGWGTYFCNCGYHVDFLVGWDLMTNYITHYPLSVGLPNKAFYYQGLSIRAQLDF